MLLLSNELRTTIRAEDVFVLVDNFFKENGLQWNKLVGCTTDGAPATLGKKSGVQSRVKTMSPFVISVLSFINRFAFTAKLLFPNLKTSLNLVVKMGNYIETSALNNCLFKVISEYIGSEYLSLLIHMDVRWLSRGNTAISLFCIAKGAASVLPSKRSRISKNS